MPPDLKHRVEAAFLRGSPAVRWGGLRCFDQARQTMGHPASEYVIGLFEAEFGDESLPEREDFAAPHGAECRAGERHIG